MFASCVVPRRVGETYHGDGTMLFMDAEGVPHFEFVYHVLREATQQEYYDYWISQGWEKRYLEPEAGEQRYYYLVSMGLTR